MLILDDMGKYQYILFFISVSILFGTAKSFIPENNVDIAVQNIHLQWNETTLHKHCKIDNRCRLHIRVCIYCKDRALTCFSGDCNYGTPSKHLLLADFDQYGLQNADEIIDSMFSTIDIKTVFTQDKYTLELAVEMEDTKTQFIRILFESKGDFALDQPSNIPRSTFANAVSNAKESLQNGLFQVQLFYQCHRNYYGPNCQTICKRNSKGYKCEPKTGKKLCAKDYYPSAEEAVSCNKTEEDVCSKWCLTKIHGLDQCDRCGLKTCKPGYELTDTGHSCKSICKPRCQNNGICTGARCICPPSFTGQACEIEEITKTVAITTITSETPVTSQATTIIVSTSNVSLNKLSPSSIFFSKLASAKKATASKSGRKSSGPKINGQTVSRGSTISLRTESTKATDMTTMLSTSPNPTINSVSPPTPTAKKSLSAGAIAGIVILVIAFVGVVAYIGVRVYRNKRKQATPPNVNVSDPAVHARSLTVENLLYELSNGNANEGENHL